MKTLTKLSLLILFVPLSITLFTGTAMAQKLEVSVNANSGLFNYTGSNLNHYYTPNTTALVTNPYSSKLTISYGAYFQAQYVYHGGFISGLQAGYDILRNKIGLGSPPHLDYYTTNLASIHDDGAGNATITTQYINVNPYIGYRFGKEILVDVTGGVDFGFETSNHQSVTINNPTGKYSQDIDNLHNDTRLKASVALWYHRFSLNLSYAHGLTNYAKYGVDYQYDNSAKAYSQLIRFGIGYCIL